MENVNVKEERKYTAYLHTNKINGKKYVGITSRNPEDRWGSNGIGYKRQPFYNAIQKYGWDNFDHEILKENLSEEEACEFEKEYIKKYNLRNSKYGYNADDGGNSASRFIENDFCSIKVLFNGIEFNSITDCAEYLNISRQNLYSWLNGKRKMPNKFYNLGLRYAEKDNSNIKCSEDIKGSNCSVIIDNIVFSSIVKCCNYINEKPKTVASWLTGSNLMPYEYYNRGLRYVYKDNSNIVCSERERIKIRKTTIDNKIFENIEEISKYINENRYSVEQWLKGKSGMPKKYYNRGLRFLDCEEYEIKIKKKCKIKISYKDKVYNTKKEFCDKNKVPKYTVSKWIEDPSKIPSEFEGFKVLERY